MKYITVDSRMINSSGIGTVLQNILKRLIPQCKEYFFYLIGDVIELDKFKFVHLPNVNCINCTAPIYSIREQWDLVRKIPPKTDLFWSPHYNIPIFYNGKMMVTIHDVFHLAMCRHIKEIHKYIYAKLMFLVIAKKVDYILCDSLFTKNELYKYINLDYGKTKVVYAGIDEFWFDKSINDSSQLNKPYILYVGNVKPHKNLIRLVKAFSLLTNVIPHNLVIVGQKDGFITSDKQVEILAGKLKDRIKFTGKISKKDLRKYYHNADIFVFPSLYEGFGLPPMEAMAAGCKKIICSDIPALKEIYGDYVRYVNPYNIDDISSSILRFIQEKNYTKNSFENLFKKFSWDKAVLQVKELI